MPEVDRSGLFVVRGELVIKRSVFRQKYKDLYSTARSFVVSQTNKGFITSAVGDLDFVAYEVISHGENDFSVDPARGFAALDLYGFTTVEHGVFPKNILMLDILFTYKDRREESVYDIDGLVLDYNLVRAAGARGRNPEFKVAFKVVFAEQLRDTEVRDVVWDISRYGRYTPVAVYKPVYINHVRIQRATAHNAAHVRDWSLGIGTVIKVARSGDTIPQIKDVEVNAEIEPIYPSERYGWHWKGRDIVLDEIESNRRVREKRMLHFVSIMNVRGVGEKTVEKLYAGGFDTIKKLIDAGEKQLMQVHGIGPVTAKKIKVEMHNSMCSTPVDRLLDALTVTSFKVSSKLIREVMRVFPYILDDKKSESEIAAILKTKKIAGIGPAYSARIAEQFPKFREMVVNLDQECMLETLKYQRDLADRLKQEGYNPWVEGKTFVFTGFMGNSDYLLEDYIF